MLVCGSVSEIRKPCWQRVSEKQMKQRPDKNALRGDLDASPEKDHSYIPLYWLHG